MKFHLISAVCLCLFFSAVSAQNSQEPDVTIHDSVQWKSFSATIMQKNVYLQWQRIQEPNTSFFIVEKSIDGINFSEMGRMQVGSNMSARVYSLTDEAPQKGAHFYRIKSVTNEHQYTYSPVKKITAGERQAFLQLFQNPVSGNNLQIVIVGQAGIPYTVRIYNAQAKLLLQKPASHGNNSIDLSGFVSGLYLAELLQNDQPAGERLWVVKQ
jgi:hypothetical protein